MKRSQLSDVSHLLLGSAVLLYLGFICHENDITHLSLNNTSKPEVRVA